MRSLSDNNFMKKIDKDDELKKISMYKEIENFYSYDKMIKEKFTEKMAN